MSNLYYDLPNPIKLIVDDLCHPIMNVCGAHQYIHSEEGYVTVLWFFDEIEFYNINLHFSRTHKIRRISGFRNRRMDNVNEQIKFFIDQLKSFEKCYVFIMKENRPKNMFCSIDYFDNTVNGILEWVPGRILEYIYILDQLSGNTQSDEQSDDLCLDGYGDMTIHCEHDPNYFEDIKDGITNKQYKFLLADCRYQFYKISESI